MKWSLLTGRYEVDVNRMTCVSSGRELLLNFSDDNGSGAAAPSARSPARRGRCSRRWSCRRCPSPPGPAPAPRPAAAARPALQSGPQPGSHVRQPQQPEFRASAPRVQRNTDILVEQPNLMVMFGTGLYLQDEDITAVEFDVDRHVFLSHSSTKNWFN